MRAHQCWQAPGSVAAAGHWRASCGPGPDCPVRASTLPVPRSVSNGGNRLATILMYLSTPEEGGETGQQAVQLRRKLHATQTWETLPAVPCRAVGVSVQLQGGTLALQSASAACSWSAQTICPCLLLPTASHC